MSDNMIEHVAKAIFFQGGEQDEMQWKHMQSHHRETALVQARAAIEAMKLPVGATSVAGGMAIEESMFACEDTVFHAAAKCWNVMVEAALADPIEQREERA